ncbi:MAG: hypothetical protein JST93_05915 [Acidobacteria bacterium]|nr:hypothetical protein [Acidobacteriota bacterium]
MVVSGTREQKQEALDAVLASRTFDRSPQLKAFLAYVCEREIEGRAETLSEYVIGVDVLGRPAGYSPAEDAIVRNRAFALRRKLDEYYLHENPTARIRIDIPRGQYAPTYVTSEAEPEEPIAATPPKPGSPPSPRKKRLPWLAPFLAGLAIASLLWWIARPGPGARVDDALRKAWGPLLRGPEVTLVHISAPLHLFVRPNDTRMPDERPRIEQEDLQRWYRHFPQLPPADKLYVRPTPNAPLWGDALSMSIVGRVLERSGVPWEVLPARVGFEPLLRNRNALILGRPEYSRVAAKLLEKLPLTVEFHPGLREYAVLDRSVANKWFLPKYGDNDYAVEVFGLISVMPSEGSPAGERRTVVLTGTNSAGAQAAAEFWSSPHEMEALIQRLGGKLPTSYQVLVRATSSATMTLDVFYETHRVITR